jgi:hypothetical protein
MLNVNMALGQKPNKTTVGVQGEDLMSRLIVILVGAFILYAINAEGSESDPATHNCSGTEMTFEDWRNWTSVTPEPVRSKGHNNNWVGIYVNELAEATYLSASSPYRVCAKIVKPIYTDASGKNVRKLTIMVKMSPGYDPENADWWYGIYDESGTDVWDEGKLPDCIICHKQATETDYLFSREVINVGTE